MDRKTRNTLQRATQTARARLELEYTTQLDGTFDIRLDGTVADTPGAHLDAQQRLLRTRLVAAVEHFCAGGYSKHEAVSAYLRELAFTTLNRFVALKMLEARGLVQECLSRGQESSGYKEFIGLVPGIVHLADHGYRLYIECLFDEVGREVRVLFDRRDPGGLLWPRRQAMRDLLTFLNLTELRAIWGEDETVGWVYQYFNSDNDRYRARYDHNGKPKAPQNTYELAVRNQFFTPRYIVQFLTDNTLGRIWYEMRRGETRLSELGYVVGRQTEVFLDCDAAAQSPANASAEDAELTQSQLLGRPIHEPSRKKKDPREIRVLDPACGSGHFLLYAFDLLLTIYDEAWNDEGSPVCKATGQTLREDYPDLDALHHALPGLILRYNLHGIDIDARCTQIAGLALWMRAQLAYKDLGIQRDARMPIHKTNIAVADAILANTTLPHEFIATLDPDVGRLVAEVFHRLKLAAHAGPLLRIEEDIRHAIRETYGQHGDLFRASDEERWAHAEEQVLTALHEYAHSDKGRAFRGRLFAEDAAAGLGYIHLCRSRYDVILMNPPFGVATRLLEPLLKRLYPQSKRELSCAFLERAMRLLKNNGLIGAIGTRTPLFIRSYADWRSAVLASGRRLHTLVDLGRGVLDATVESAAYIVGPDQGATGVFFKGLEGGMVIDEIADRLRRATRDFESLATYIQHAREFSRIPNCPIAYWVSPSLANTYSAFQRFELEGREASSGASTNDDFRFIRLWCEVPPDSLGQSRDDTFHGRPWIALAKGGEYSPYYRNLELVVNWTDDGSECKAHIADYRGKKGWGYHWAAALNGYPNYFRPGVTWSRRTSTWISARALPAGCIFGDKGPAAFLPNNRPIELCAVLGWMNSSTAGALLALSVGKEGSAGTAGSNSYEVGIVERLPYPGTAALIEAGKLALQALRLRRDASLTDELSRLFSGPVSRDPAQEERVQKALSLQISVDRAVGTAFGLDASTVAGLHAGSRIEALDPSEPYEGSLRNVQDCGPTHLQWIVGCVFGRWCSQRHSAQTDVLPGPFDPLPSQPPAWGVSDGRWVLSEGIAVDDEGHTEDIVSKCAVASNEIGIVRLDCDLRPYLRREFFSFHISSYTRSRRKAPIYWQLAPPSASYSVWLYYHRLTRDTFFRVLNDYVTPKLRHEERGLATLVEHAEPTASHSQRKEIEAHQRFVGELRAFRDEVARVAPLWKPDLRDGVVINFAPLWRLVSQNRSWQKQCKKVWDDLVAGDFDWSHLAMHLWPERVVPKCTRDRSLAIAHGFQEHFWEEGSDGKWRPKNAPRSVTDRLIAERSSVAVKAALEELVRVPAPATSLAPPSRWGSGGGSTQARTLHSTSAQANTGSTVDHGTLDAMVAAIGQARDGASRAEIVDAIGISQDQWNAAIKELLSSATITKTGQARGTRYHLAKGDGL